MGVSIVCYALKKFYQNQLAREKGTLYKDWKGKLKIALVYPNTYFVGMSNLGFQSVYGILNRFPEVVCERAFLPHPEEQTLLKKHNSPLVSYESQRPLKDFDLLAFSISFENDYLNVLKILSLAHIPLFKTERSENYPLVVAGGIAIWLNPEPLADYIDFFLIGEGEAFLEEFIQAYMGLLGEKKEIFLKQLSQKVVGVYVPSGYQVSYNEDGTIKSFIPKKHFPFPIKKRGIQDFCFAQTQIVTPDTEFSSMFLIEIKRGCLQGCRFCRDGYLYRPPRMRSLKEIYQIIQQGLKLSSKIGLVGRSVNDHPHLLSLIKFILNHGGSFFVSTLRTDKLSSTLLEALKKSQHKTITIAPETGTQRLRDVINKGLSEEQILEAVYLIAQFGFKTLKLYFMVGLPTETQEDLENMVILIKKIKKTMLTVKEGRFCPHIHLSVSSFVPKPFTPFQWHPMESIENLKKKIRWLKSAFKRKRGVSITFDIPKWAYTQALLSRGDRRVGKILYLAFKNDWQEAFKLSPINPDFFVLRQRGKDEVFPWEIISHGLDKEFLYMEYNRALQAKPSPIRNCTCCEM